MVPKDARILLPRTCDNDIWMVDGTLQIQAYLILLQSILLWFTAIAFFFSNWRFEGLQPCVQQVYCAISPTCARILSHFGCCCCPVAKLCSILCNLMDCSTPGFPVLHYLPEFLLKLMSIESMMPSSHFILCCPLLLLPSIFPSIKAVSSELALCIRWPKYWSFSFSISPSNEYSELISFRLDWLDLLAVQRDSQESSPTPQFKSITSSALILLYSPALTSIHDHWENRISD